MISLAAVLIVLVGAMLLEARAVAKQQDQDSLD
jgi:hypothetical protein